MRRLIQILMMVALTCAAVVRPAVSQDMTALAFAQNEGSVLRDKGLGFRVELSLTQPVPYRIFTLDAPKRVVIDFAKVDFSGLDVAAFHRAGTVSEVRVGEFMAGWSRMVLALDVPVELRRAERDGDRLLLTFRRVGGDEFARAAGTPEAVRAQMPQPYDAAQDAVARAPLGDRPIKVMLDPGHGGIDPGAERDGIKESELMLQFAHELRDVLIRSDRFDVTLTRETDTFVPLEARVGMAQAAGVDAFISLHADALAKGVAQGATIYTLAEHASDEASQKLAERHNRDALLSGVDLSGNDDEIAVLLLDIARNETRPRTDRLANAIVVALSESVGTYKRPRLEAGFSVLKSADIPSVLLELGFLSTEQDRERLLNQAWRLRAATAIKDAFLQWEQQEIIAAGQARQ